MTTLSELHTYNLRFTKESDLKTIRIRKGRGFQYISERAKDKEYIDAIKKLRIPPAWNDVRISTSLNTHILAIGFDEKGRKQYIYNPRWNEMQKMNKFNKMVFFGEILPELRLKVHADMETRGLSREKVVATIIWLLEHTFIRIGNEEYAKENKTFGLTTIQNKHVDVSGHQATFQFKGKSGVNHEVEIHDKRVAKVIYKCQELPEQQLFEYIDQDGSRKDVNSHDVNEYLKSITGEEISAKDFRTWGGTVYAANDLYLKGESQTQTEMKKNIVEAIKLVSHHLRNTTAVCRNYYIHPAIIKTYEEKILIPHFDTTYKHFDTSTKLHKKEFATWSLLKDQK